MTHAPGWGQPPTEPPPPGPPRASLLRRKGVQLGGAGLVGLVVGIATAGGGSAGGDGSTGDVAALRTQVADLTEARDTAIGQRDQATKRGNDISEAARKAAAPAPAASPSPAAPASPPPSEVAEAPAPAPESVGGDTTDGSFTLVGQQIKDDGLGDFGGTARVKNTSDAEKTALITLTVFRGGKQVAALQGAADSVGPGDTATVQLISQDAYLKGPYSSVEFQVSAES